MTHHRTPLTRGLLIVLALALTAGGCRQEKPRLESGEISRYETRDPRPLPVIYDEFAEQLAQDFAQDMSTIKGREGINSRVTIAFGDIVNKTGNVSSSEFEMIRNSMRTRLTQSEMVQREVRFVENRARMNALIRTETGQTAEVDRIDLDNAWVLNMDVLRASRGRFNEYQAYVRLVDFRTGTILFERQYQSRQVRQR
ncbi:MAG: hypothetical protein JJU36_03755 [Phycisphaeraceae bacterium]|nr:hypothetical protein [Phycisphaeraceae bacterium]